MTRICYIGNAESPHLLKWINYFAQEDFEVSVISSHPSNMTNAVYYKDRLPRVIKLLNSVKFLKPIYFMVLIWTFKKLFEEIEPDLVHIHQLSIFGAASALANFHPTVVSTWGTDVRTNNFVRAYLKKRALGRADYVTATSKVLKKQTENLIEGKKTIEVVPFGVDLKEFDPEKIKSGKDQNYIVIGFVKWLKKIYGPEILLDIFLDLNKEFNNLKLVFGGDGEEEEKLKEIVKKNKLQEKVVFLGRITIDKVSEVLSSFDIFVMPTQVPESFGVSALEASAMELPVIASNIGGIPEIVKDKETGLLFNPGDKEDLKGKIIRLIKDEKLREKLGNNGRRFVAENYSWDKSTKKMEEIYQKVLANYEKSSNGGK
ncbi:MAG: glycosyltransferase family 4 protein [Candidatus Woykebacteria bacterium]